MGFRWIKEQVHCMDTKGLVPISQTQTLAHRCTHTPSYERFKLSVQRGGHWGLWFWPFFASVFRSFKFWSLVLRFSTAPRFAVISPYRTQYMVCRCCSRFFGGFITHTLHAALQCYTDIIVLVFNNFGHHFAVFGALCCGFVVFAIPQCPPLQNIGLIVQA